MKKLIFLTTTFLSIFYCCTLPAQTIVFHSPNVHFVAQQPITAIFIDQYGHEYSQVVYYDPLVGGVTLSNSNQYVSVYFPAISVSYLWNNGSWVGRDGYYWKNGVRYQMGPAWHDHWNHYWGSVQGWHGERGQWHGGYFERSGGWEGRSGEHQERSGGWEGRSGEHQERSGSWEGRSGEHQERSGGWEGRSGEHQERSGGWEGRSGEHQERSGGWERRGGEHQERRGGERHERR